MIFWFFFELRATHQQEINKNKLGFYKLIGVVYCLWFLYLPVAVIVASQINLFVRAKFLIGKCLQGRVDRFHLKLCMIKMAKHAIY